MSLLTPYHIPALWLPCVEMLLHRQTLMNDSVYEISIDMFFEKGNLRGERNLTKRAYTIPFM